MNIFNLRLINVKINPLNICIFISLFIHIFIILTINKRPITKTKGDKYIPIELIDIDSFSGAGESLNKQIKKDKLKTNQKDFNKNIQKQETKEKKQKEISNVDEKEKIFETNKKENKESKKKIIRTNPTDKTQIKTKKGSKTNIEENNIPEKGSVKGKSKIEITCLRCVSPKYPTRALRRGAEGKPFVKVWINRLGKVTRSELIKSSGNDSIDKAALLAANKSTFYPVEIDTTLIIEYELKIRK